MSLRFQGFAFFSLFLFSCSVAFGGDGDGLWLKHKKIGDEGVLRSYRSKVTSIHVSGTSETCARLKVELRTALHDMLGGETPFMPTPEEAAVVVGTPDQSPFLRARGYAKTVERLGDEGYVIHEDAVNGKRAIIIAAQNDIGLLYGTFHFLRLLQTHRSLDRIAVEARPRIRYRVLNHWDNLDGSVERGYAGRSLWNWETLPDVIDPRCRDYARANASVGINGTVLNNVNANPAFLLHENLKKVAALADVFRPYGIRVYLSANFSSPLAATFDLDTNRKGGIGELSTSDPLDPAVRRWWKDKADEIYALIPDFGGFLVKANSESMPGPRDYGRTHAEGANMLADALAPHGGIVMWRTFVYDAAIDPDRTKRPYLEFVPLDSLFRPNVILQAKNGPLDFQPREPVQPLSGAMRHTPVMPEFQITQEYLGHSTHLVFLAPMWKEALSFDLHSDGPGSTLSALTDGTLRSRTITAIAGVSNAGDDRNWCGHFFAQANWYAFGRLAWDHSLAADAIAEEWIRMSLTADDEAVRTVQEMMLGSWEACISYMTPLGLHHIMQEGFHYGPQPQHSAGREDWTSVYYHRADSVGLGYDRSSTGTNAVGQYAEQCRLRFDDMGTCPEAYLLWFHHVPWDRSLSSGRALWDELVFRYTSGVEYVDRMIDRWSSLREHIDPEIHAHVSAKLRTQLSDAGIWKDTCLSYFQTFSKLPIRMPQEVK